MIADLSVSALGDASGRAIAATLQKGSVTIHYTDTGDFSGHVFAMCRLLGFLFARAYAI